MTSAVSVAKSRLIEAGIATRDSIQGCREEQIACIESWLSVRLPRAYRDFLAEMGLDAGDFLVGFDWVFDEVLWFRKSAENFIAHCESDFALWGTDYVFFFNPGCGFLYFDCEAGEDPPVFDFSDSEGDQPRKVFDSFSDWLLAAVEDQIAIRRQREALGQELRKRELRRRQGEQ